MTDEIQPSSRTEDIDHVSEGEAPTKEEPLSKDEPAIMDDMDVSRATPPEPEAEET